MIKSAPDSKTFDEVIRELLGRGLNVRFEARGPSMSPAIRDGEMVEITPVIASKVRRGDIVLAKSDDCFRLHRIVQADHASNVFVTRGDCGQSDDPRLQAGQILGLARSKGVQIGQTVLQARFRGIHGWALRSAGRTLQLCSTMWRKTGSATFVKNLFSIQSLLVLAFLFLAASLTSAQVAVDASTSASNEFTGGGTFALNFTHTTAAAANRLLIVGVSLNITNAPAAAVSGVTYNGTALTLIGAQNDAGNTRRVEMWFLLNPVSGTNLPVSVSVNIPTGGAVVGVVAGATTLAGVDQTLPLGSFVSADGAGGTNSQLDAPSVVNGMIIDTLAIGGNRTATPLGPQVQQWNATTASGTDPPGVTGVGSSRTGAPSVPIAETFSGASNWSLGAVSVNPSTADIAVTTSVSAVQLGQNSTYNITITNNGPSAANNVTLTDTFAATNLSLVSATPSSGTTCTTATTINCTLPTPFASGATATVAVVVKTTAAGFYPNTATVSDSGTPPDPNTGNNTYVSLAPVIRVVCSATIPPAGGTLTGVVNTYFPGTANVGAGATSIPIGAATGAGGTIANGSLLLVIQMQDASISTSNTVAYGNGSTGSGFTTINNAGNYEFVKATGPVAGGLVPISGAGAGGGLVFGYTAAAALAGKGVSTFQVVLVPQYSTATLGAVTASAWNGSTGGIFALDVAGQLNLGSATVSVDGLGFRGGAGMQLTGNGAGSAADFRFPAPATYTGAAEGGADAAKGEGVAGTPEWVESGGTFLQTVAGVGYPSGTAGIDGSMAHGAPGNAGGGGTDAHPSANDQNAGGGGGGNGGGGGFGGDSWNTNLSTGGFGGGTFPATIDRIAMGGGGGAGTRNNSGGDNQASGGAAGGGIIFIRADSFTGTATLTANGSAAYNATQNDAGGGGGSGGTIVVLAANGGEGGLALQANGGRGGNAWQSQAYNLANRHGPGGGGAGGVIFLSGAPASMSVAGGGPGLTLNPGVPYGATAGDSGITVTNATLGQVTGIQSASLCSPDMSLTKSHIGNFTRGAAASYTITISNVSPYGPSSGLVTMNDTLPLGMSPTGAGGTGWACSISGQTVSCTRADSLPAASSYPVLTLNASVLQSAPATLTNIATVAGGGEFNLLNDSAVDVANAVSISDLAVTDSGSPNPVASGANLTYSLLATNTGPSAADNATLVVNVPTNSTFVSLSAAAGWTCQTPAVGAAGNVVCTNAFIGAPGAAAFTLVVKVNAGVAIGTVITQTASVSSSVSDPALSNNTAVVTTIVGGSTPNLSVTNVASPNPVQASSNITYTQVVTNTGSSAITNATFTEATPANTTFVSVTPPAGWTCTGFPASPCIATTVAAGVSGTFTAVYTVNALTPAGTTITDTVTVNATNQSFGASSAVAIDTVATATQADVALSTAATPNPIFAGNDITYTQTISDKGPASAAGVVFTQATPANTTFQSVSAPAGWNCTTPAVGGTGTVQCTDGNSLASGTAANIVVVVGTPANVAGTVTANSSVTATTGDPNSGNNGTTVLTQVNLGCDLGITNSGVPNPVAAGSNITYTQVVNNTGPSYCTNSTLSEATPANTTFVSVGVVTTGGGAWNCPNSAPIACANPSVPPGSTATITAVYRVNAGTTGGTIITDTATVGSGSPDTNGNNNTATVNIAVGAGGQSDLSITNSGSPNPVTAGNNITYTQSVTNAGPGPANAPTLTETLPPNTTAQSLTGPAGWNCVLASRTCTDTLALAANATANFTFVVTVNPTVAAGTILTQTASINSTTSDPNPANNSASVNTVVGNSADLSVTNSPSPTPVLPGAVITYSQVVNNAGPTTATSVTLTNTLPANTTATSLAGPAGWTCTLATLTCTIPTLAAGAPATITYRVTVSGAAIGGTQISETATVSSSIADPDPVDNSATAVDVVAVNGTSDLVVTNSATPTTVAAGNNVTYTQTVTNLGPSRATGTSFNQATPPNTTFQSITATGGFNCGTTPAVGGTGIITCTHGANWAVGNSATFTLILQVNAGTPSGTSITDTATATATDIIPNLTTNTASATVVVANANSADVAIVKTATPNPVTEGTLLTYSLTVTNNGPASATTVTVTDTLPSVVTYLTSTTTQGSCSEANGIVTCLLGSMPNAGIATITIVTVAGQPGVVVNTATVIAEQADPTSANNTSTQTETITAPTWVTLQSFLALMGKDKNGANRVVLTWRTGGEAHNLGFNLYREVNGNRLRLNASIIAGSALLMNGALPRHAGRTYTWMDPSIGVAGASYWLEDIDVNGTRTMHGPVSVNSGAPISDAPAVQARMLSQLNQAQPSLAGEQSSHFMQSRQRQGSPTATLLKRQSELAAHPAVKIYVNHEGWYRVAQPDLVKAGLDPDVDPGMLHLYAEAVEQPMQITGARPGAGGFGPQAAINFYGTGIDTVYSGARVYWLTTRDGRGERIVQLSASSGSNQPPSSFLSTVELRQHLVYFSALLTADGQNFFGGLVSTTSLDQVLTLPNLDPSAAEAARLEISLQGAITGFPHDVNVVLNGTPMGDITFIGQAKGTLTMNVPSGVLVAGDNTVTLTAQNGELDTSLVEYIRVTYPHLYVADSNLLKFTGRAGDGLTLLGFTSVPIVLDITDPDQPLRLTTRSGGDSGSTVGIQVPFFTTSTSTGQTHTLLAVAGDRISAPAAILPNHPSIWHRVQKGADIAIVTYPEFAEALVPLVRAHEAEGKTSAVIAVTDLYDEFNFGERSPFAIKQFLETANQNWKKPPHYLLLNGRASLDPRNYLGLGDLDLVPTRIEAMGNLMTASDDWFSDFNDSGLPTIPTGRLPVNTLEEARTVVSKIVAYEGSSTDGPWTTNALMVADKDDTESFTQDTKQVQAELPTTMRVSNIWLGTLGTTGGDIVNAINSGQLLVDYIGHGSEEQWAGSNVFDTNSVSLLTNKSQLPVFLIMDCLNGMFQDATAQPLGVTLLLAPNGGAVAVLASSGLNQPEPQTQLNTYIARNAFASPASTLGDSILKAKSEVTDIGVRQTYVLFGDPAMRIKRPKTSSGAH